MTHEQNGLSAYCGNASTIELLLILLRLKARKTIEITALLNDIKKRL